MRRIRRSVITSYSQMHFNTPTVEPAISGEPSSAMEALEQQVDQSKEAFGDFVKGEVLQTDTPKNPVEPAANPEVMQLDEDIEIDQKDVPEAVFGSLKRKSTTDETSISRRKR